MRAWGLRGGATTPPHVTEIDMKQKFLAAAGLLCLGTGSALAYTIPAMAPDMAKAVKAVWTDQMAAERTSTFDTGEAWMGEAKAPKAQNAAAATFDDAGKTADATVETAALGDPDLSVKPDDGLAKSGPSEAVMQPISTPAAAAYPPCRPGAGDDRCIQLYEPGVRAQLAGWNRSASGSDSAMGGPYEPVDTTLAGEMGGTGGGATPIAMNGDGAIDPALGETADAAAPAGAEYTGTGGPLEEVDYPACSRTVTDSCIQLYERGVHR
jgi:hypothetical protein